MILEAVDKTEEADAAAGGVPQPERHVVCSEDSDVEDHEFCLDDDDEEDDDTVSIACMYDALSAGHGSVDEKEQAEVIAASRTVAELK